MDRLRRAIQRRSVRGTPAPLPTHAIADALESTSLFPSPLANAARPTPSGRSVPPIIGQIGYFDGACSGLAWQINGSPRLCHFSAPKWYYPGAGPVSVGVVDSVGESVPCTDLQRVPHRTSPVHVGTDPQGAAREPQRFSSGPTDGIIRYRDQKPANTI